MLANSTGRARLPALAALTLGLCLATVGGCSKDDSAPAQVSPASVPSGAAPAADEPSRAPSASRALRITTETTLAASDVTATVDALRASVVNAGGYVSELRTSDAVSGSAADLEARIPSAQLSSFRSGLSRSGDILADSEKAEDVTEQRADLAARLHSARVQEKRLLEMLSDRTGGIADVIAAEKALADVRTQVERLEAQREALEGQIAYATVKIHVVHKQHVAAISPTGRIGAAATRGVDLLGAVAVGAAVLAMTVGPTLLMLLSVGALAFAIARKIAKRLPRGRPSPSSVPASASASASVPAAASVPASVPASAS